LHGAIWVLNYPQKGKTMHVSLHPSQWFHHETVSHVQLPETHRLREWLHNGTFWSITLLIAVLCAIFVLALLAGGKIGSGPYTTYFVP
jgi:hypothetical protein